MNRGLFGGVLLALFCLVGGLVLAVFLWPTPILNHFLQNTDYHFEAIILSPDRVTVGAISTPVARLENVVIDRPGDWLAPDKAAQIRVGNLTIISRPVATAPAPTDPREIFASMLEALAPLKRSNILVQIDQVQMPDKQASGTLVFNVQGDQKISLQIKNIKIDLNMKPQHISIQGNADIDYSGQDKNIQCRGRIDVGLGMPVPIVGKKFAVVPSCAVKPLMAGFDLVATEDNPFWQSAAITLPIVDGAIHQANLVIEGRSPYSITPLHAEWTKNNFSVNGFQVTTQEGKMAVSSLDYDLNRQSVAGVVTLEQINPAAVLARYPIKGLSLEGAVTGTIPFTVDRGKVTLHQGHVFSKDGIIRYMPDAAASDSLAQSGGGIALAALADFHYSNLEIILDGQQGDEQSVQVILSGHNPALYDGYPVVIRLNLSGALENLLQQGQATLSLPERIKLERQKKLDKQAP